MIKKFPSNNTGNPNQLDFRTDLERQNWALLAHVAATAALARSENTRDLIEGVCQGIVSQWPYVLAWVGIAEHDEKKTVSVLGAHGAAAKYAEGINVTWSREGLSGRGPVGACIETAQSQIVVDTEADPEFELWRERARAFGIRSCIAVPIRDDRNLALGALTVYASIPNAFAETEVRLFESLAQEIGFGMKSIKRERLLDLEINQKLNSQEQLANALRATIEAMSKTMEWRDPYTAGHQRRVANIAVAIAKDLAWPSDKIYGLYMAATVHDIGKVAIPSEILTKPTHLTGLEMRLVQEHPETGYQILKDIPFPWPIAEIVRQHHERLDGSGYPSGLKGAEILDEARVIAVADMIEAIGSHRPYRAALGMDAAMAEIRAESGIKLDPIYVDAALRLVKSGALQPFLT
jgi:HD-GYP domain-containing protein (c-di-GMP phosphodiesterase class II)